jgi:hypothetical protein
MRKNESIGKNREIIDHLPMLKCKCGAEILLLSDLREMSHAIKVHVAEHRNNMKDHGNAAADERVENALISQAFRLASRQEN